MGKRLEKVLVALKPGEPGIPLSAYHARVLSQRLGARMRLMSCVYETQVAADLALSHDEAYGAQAGLLEAERRELRSLSQSLIDWGVEVDIRARWGWPMQDLVVAEAEKWGADLLVIGAHGSGRPHLTDVDWRIMTDAPCPLLVVKDPNFEEYPRIIACVDPLHRHAEPSGLDGAVIDVATTLAEAFDAELSLLHAYPPPEAFELASSVEVSPGVFYGSENVEDVHRRAVTDLMEVKGLSPDAAALEPGSPVDVISEYVRRTRTKLAVIGAVKRDWVGRALLGSTAEKVAAATDCDVLLVKAADQGRRPDDGP